MASLYSQNPYLLRKRARVIGVVESVISPKDTDIPKEQVTRSGQWKVTPSRRNQPVEAIKGYRREHWDRQLRSPTWRS
jgi:hypothetical protein